VRAAVRQRLPAGILLSGGHGRHRSKQFRPERATRASRYTDWPVASSLHVTSRVLINRACARWRLVLGRPRLRLGWRTGSCVFQHPIGTPSSVRAKALILVGPWRVIIDFGNEGQRRGRVLSRRVTPDRECQVRHKRTRWWSKGASRIRTLGPTPSLAGRQTARTRLIFPPSKFIAPVEALAQAPQPVEKLISMG